MSANTTPIFGLTPNIGFGIVTTANTAVDGTGTQVTTYTAGANGGFLYNLTFEGQGTNIQTVATVTINNGSANSTATNNTHLLDLTLPATTSSNTTAIPSVIQPMNMYVPAGYKINISIRTTVAAGYAVTGNGLDY